MSGARPVWRRRVKWFCTSRFVRSSFRVILTKIAEQDINCIGDFTYSVYCPLSLSQTGPYSAIARLPQGTYLVKQAVDRKLHPQPSRFSSLSFRFYPSIPSRGISSLHRYIFLFALRPCPTTLHLQRLNRYRYPPERQRQSVRRAAATAFPSSRGHPTTLKPPPSRLRLGLSCL